MSPYAIFAIKLHLYFMFTIYESYIHFFIEGILFCFWGVKSFLKKGGWQVVVMIHQKKKNQKCLVVCSSLSPSKSLRASFPIS